MCDPLVTQMQAVALAQLATEMRHVAAVVLLAVEPQHLRDGRQRYAPWAGSTSAPIKEPVVTELLIAVFPPPHGAATDAENLGGLPPLELSRDCFENHLLDFHRPLHGWHRLPVHRTSSG
jgi:hypothetical protein